MCLYSQQRMAINCSRCEVWEVFSESWFLSWSFFLKWTSPTSKNNYLFSLCWPGAIRDDGRKNSKKAKSCYLLINTGKVLGNSWVPTSLEVEWSTSKMNSETLEPYETIPSLHFTKFLSVTLLSGVSAFILRCLDRIQSPRKRNQCYQLEIYKGDKN